MPIVYTVSHTVIAKQKQGYYSGSDLEIDDVNHFNFSYSFIYAVAIANDSGIMIFITQWWRHRGSTPPTFDRPCVYMAYQISKSFGPGIPLLVLPTLLH